MRTYQGRTAGGWIKKAVVIETVAGIPEIMVADLPGCVLRSHGGALVIRNSAGIVAALPCSATARRELDDLEAEL